MHSNVAFQTNTNGADTGSLVSALVRGNWLWCALMIGNELGSMWTGCASQKSHWADRNLSCVVIVPSKRKDLSVLPSYSGHAGSPSTFGSPVIAKFDQYFAIAVASCLSAEVLKRL